MARVERTIAGRTLTIESGRLAKQADAAALVTYGETIVLTAVVARPARAELGFFPLTVEYREKQYAAGKFPGGIIKREGRPTTKEILTMRLTDRPIRPLFPEDYMEDLQVITTVLSADLVNDPDILSMVGASAALSISDIPFQGPIGACRVGLANDEFVINPTHKEREDSELEIVVSGTAEAILTVSGSAQVIPEEDVLTAIGLAQDANVEIVGMIEDLVRQCGKPKRTYSTTHSVQSTVELLKPRYGQSIVEAHRTPQHAARKEALEAIVKDAVAEFCNAADDAAPSQNQIRRAVEKLEGLALREQILQEGKRYDGRGPDDLREIQCEVAVLPRTHGSALFTRGETQALVITTLGTVSDEQRILDPLVEEDRKKFMLHYNFPPFCVGEVRPIRGPGRREIGHGQLAEGALHTVLPTPDKFPYTIRLVSDILESNGSSSMATVCGGALSMMDAGVPIKDPVAGLAMGLVMGDGQKVILSDIAGAEDHYGDMDFKLAGTQRGLTALQLDLKVSGVDRELLQEVLKKARDARMQILRAMLGALREPRSNISPYAPLLQRISIDPEKIGLIIGPGGRTIRGLEERFNCEIEVEDDGTVTVSSTADGDADSAAKYIHDMVAGSLEVGKVYTGKVTGVKEFGAIVELFPGTDGLCHISQLDEGYVKNVEDICKMGDQIQVKVISVEGNRVKLSRKAAMQEAGGK